jgi:signal transduction histidine kinase
LTGSSLFRTQIILFGCILWAACNSSEQPARSGNANLAATTRFLQQLDSLKQEEDDSLRSVRIRTLYHDAPKNIHDAVSKELLQSLTQILYYNTHADPGLMPFMHQLGADSTLSIKNRFRASLSLATYHAHITHLADSAERHTLMIGAQTEVLDDSLKAKLYATEGQILQLRGKLQEASARLYKSLGFYERINDSASIAATNINLANVYRSMSDFAKASQLRKKALAYFTSKGNDGGRVVALQGLAADLSDLDRFDEARPYAVEAERLFASGVRNPVAEYYLYLTNGATYISLRKYDSSVYYFDKAKELLALFNDEDQEMVFVMASSIAYSHFRDVTKEAASMEQYIQQLLADENLVTAKDVYFSLYNMSLRRKLSREPIDYYQSYDSLRTILADKSNREFLAEMESKYESQKKSLQIDVQKKEIERRKNLNAILILSIITVAVSGSLLLARFKLQRSRKEAKLQQQFTLNLLKNTEEERRRIAGELHDGIGHELLSLKNNLQQGVSTTETKIDTIINDLRMISRNLHPVMLDQIGLEYSIRHLCDQVMSGGQLFVSAEIDYRNQLTRDDELQLYRIIQESLTNVIKYAGALAARITIETKDDKLVVTIIDNGKGFDLEEKMRSQPAFGLNSLVQRSKALGGKIHISSTAQGTQIHLEIPVHHAVHSNS